MNFTVLLSSPLVACSYNLPLPLPPSLSCSSPLSSLPLTHTYTHTQWHIHHIFNNSQIFPMLKEQVSITPITSHVFLQLFIPIYFCVILGPISWTKLCIFPPLDLGLLCAHWYNVHLWASFELDPSLFLPSFTLSLTQKAGYLTVGGIVFH